MRIGTAIRALTARTVRVSAMLERTQRHPQKQLGTETVQRGFALLADDMRQNQAAAYDASCGVWPEGFDDKDVRQYARAIQRGWLATSMAAVFLAALKMEQDGCDVEALRWLGRALSSAMTGSGVEHKKLVPPSIQANTPEPWEIDLRARLVCLAELCRGDRTKLRRLYDAVEGAGLNRKMARRIVEYARAGKLKDPTFSGSLAYWKERFAPLVAPGPDVAELLDPFAPAPPDELDRSSRGKAATR
jgi:hypothetical protein